MQIDGNTFQSKLPSLEEGPTRYNVNDYQSYNLKRSGRSSKYQRCMEVIKVILYLELVLFVGWIGCIILTNYYAAGPFMQFDTTDRNQVEFTNDVRTNDSSVNTKNIFDGDVNDSRFHDNTEETVTTERSEISTTPIMAVDDSVETETTTALPISSETTESNDDMPLWKWFQKMNIPIIVDDNMDRSIEDEKSRENLQYDSPKKEIVVTDDSVGLREIIVNADSIGFMDDSVTDDNVGVPFPIPTWLENGKIDSTSIPRDEVDVSNDETDAHSTVAFNGDLEKLTMSYPELGMTDSIEQPDEYKDYFLSDRVTDEASVGNEKIQPEGIDPEVPIDDQIVRRNDGEYDLYDDYESFEQHTPKGLFSWFNPDTFPEPPSDLRSKRSADSSSSSSEEKNGANKSSSSSSSSSSEEKTDKDCSGVSYYEEDGDEITRRGKNVNSLVDKIMKLHAEKSKPDCGDKKVIIAVTDCGQLSYVCSSAKIDDDSSEEDNDKRP